MKSLLKGLKDEEKFILYAIQIKPLKENSLCLDFNITNLDWDYIIKIGERERICCFIYSAVKRLNIHLNKYQFNKLKELKNKEEYIQLLWMLELKEVLKSFNRNNIEVVLLKGGYLAFNIYPQGFRRLSDIDILVRKADILNIKNILKQNGFNIVYSISEVNNLTFRNKSGITFEVHTELGILSDLIDVDEFFNNTMSIKINNISCKVLKPDYNLIYLSLHYSITHSFYNLVSLADINEFIRKENKRIDIVKTINFSKKNSIYKAVFIPISFTNVIWETKLDGFTNHISLGLLLKYLIKYNFKNSLSGYNNKIVTLLGYVIPILLVGSFMKNFKIISKFLYKRILNIKLIKFIRNNII